MTETTADPAIEMIDSAVALLKPVDPEIATTAAWPTVKEASEARSHRAEVDGW
jgi:hypothetical protein